MLWQPYFYILLDLYRKFMDWLPILSYFHRFVFFFNSPLKFHWCGHCEIMWLRNAIWLVVASTPTPTSDADRSTLELCSFLKRFLTPNIKQVWNLACNGARWSSAVAHYAFFRIFRSGVKKASERLSWRVVCCSLHLVCDSSGREVYPLPTEVFIAIPAY